MLFILHPLQGQFSIYQVSSIEVSHVISVKAYSKAVYRSNRLIHKSKKVFADLAELVTIIKSSGFLITQQLKQAQVINQETAQDKNHGQ